MLHRKHIRTLGIQAFRRPWVHLGNRQPSSNSDLMGLLVLSLIQCFRWIMIMISNDHVFNFLHFFQGNHLFSSPMFPSGASSGLNQQHTPLNPVHNINQVLFQSLMEMWRSCSWFFPFCLFAAVAANDGRFTIGRSFTVCLGVSHDSIN